jgi:hypothetical protein
MFDNRNNYIPIDFVKAQVKGMKEDELINSSILEPKSIFVDGVLTQTIYSYQNIKIKVFENDKQIEKRIELSGSLHVFFNDGKHNYNDFGRKKFESAINKLYECFNIVPKDLYLIKLEWGYNIKPPMNTNYILDRLVQHKSVNKTVGIDCEIDGKYIQFKHSTMIFKTYNKGQQHKLNKDLLRIEIKQTNWSKYRLKGIITLQDFIEADKTIFFNELIYQWKSVILYDINDKITDEYIKYQTTTFWDNRRKHFNRKSVKYHFDILRALNKTKGYDCQNKIIDELIKKGNELQL